MTLIYPELMDTIDAFSKGDPSRRFETYCRKEAVLSFISGSKDILDAGCGIGFTSVCLARKGHRVTGIDASGDGINIAMEMAKAGAAPVDFRVMDIEKSDLPDASYDLIICEETLEHLSDPEAILRKFKRHLRDGGEVIISVPNATSLRAMLFNLLGQKNATDCPDHKHRFTTSMIEDLMRRSGLGDIRITSDFIPIPKLPIKFLINARKRIAKIVPFLGHHIIACGKKISG